jgi:hypothetical protein
MPYIKGSPSHFTDDMTDSVTVYKASTRDAYGKYTTAANGTSYACRIMAEVTRTRDTEGKQVVEGGKLIILNDADVAINDRLVLSAGSEPLVIGVDKVTYKANGAGTAIHHTVVRFGRG